MPISGGQTEIKAPGRTTFGHTLPGIQSAIGASPTVAGPQIRGVNIGALPTLGKVQGIQGFGDDYYKSLLEKSRNALQKEYYGAGGLTEKSEEVLASRGGLGSTMEFGKSGTRAQIGGDFGERMAGMLSDLNRMQTEERVGEAKDVRSLQQERDITGYKTGSERTFKEAEMANTRAVSQAGFDLDASMKNADLAAAYKELGIRSALTEAAEASKFDVGMFEQNVNLEEVAADRERARRQSMVDLMSSPNVDMDRYQTDSIMNQMFSDTGYGPAGDDFATAASGAGAGGPQSISMQDATSYGLPQGYPGDRSHPYRDNRGNLWNFTGQGWERG